MLIPIHIRHVVDRHVVFTEGHVNPDYVQAVTESVRGEWSLLLRNAVRLEVDGDSARRVIGAMQHG
jgi:hypothetical protein